MTVDELLSETVGSARDRERALFDRLVRVSGERLVLFGAGVLGQKVLAALRSAGIEPLAFADNNLESHGTMIANLPVLSPREAAVRWGAEAIFVVTIFRATGDDGMDARMASLRRLGCRVVISFLSVAWRFEGVLPHFGADLPSRFLAHAEELRRVHALWGDQLSRDTFRRQLAWRLQDDFSGVGAPVPDQYFPKDLLRPNDEEVFVDGGAFDGDTLRRMPWSFSSAWAIEPDPQTVIALRKMNDVRIVVCETALGVSAGEALFDARGTIGSARSERGASRVRVSSLDGLLTESRPTFVKLDIEGDELTALHGAQKMLRSAAPVAAICVYHRPEDLWTIPLFLREVLPTHRLFLRIHERDGFELVAYAIPPERLV